jgi:hypothetical protein
MKIAFLDPGLASACGSRTLLEDRWGSDWACIARRLNEIAASPSLAAVAHLPFTSVIPLRGGEFDLMFSEGVTVRVRAAHGRPADRKAPDAVLAVTITTVAVSSRTSR